MLLNKSKTLKVFTLTSVNGFALIELLVVVVILGIIATVTIYSFNSAQAISRDDMRKNDLKKIAAALQLYYSDYGAYPISSSGQIKGCLCSSVLTVCVWGAVGCTSAFTDNVTIYMRIVPADPSGYNYYYRTVDVGAVNQGYQLYAHLENLRDSGCLPGSNGKPNCASPANIPSGVTCGAGVACNFALTSPKVAATQE